MLKSCDVFIFYIFTTVQTLIWVPLELFTKNRIILIRDG